MTINRVDSLLRRALAPSDRVPDELNTQLKNKLKGVSVMKHKSNAFSITAKCAGVAIVLFLTSVTVLTNASAEISTAIQDIPLIGTIAKVVTFRTYEDSKNDFTAYVEIPEIDGLGVVTDELNRQIRNYTDGIIAMYEKDRDSTNGKGHLAMTTGYDIMTDTDDYFSIRVWTDIVMAGANESAKFFTVDKKNERILTLSALFADGYDYKTFLYKEITAQMRDRMAKSPDLTYFIGNDEFSFSEISGDENFYIDKDGALVIAFNEYDVAPGFMGMQDFTVGKIESGALA